MHRRPALPRSSFSSLLVAAASSSALLAACGAGGSTDSGAVEGLSVAEQMSVITADSGVLAGPASGGVAPGAQADTSGFPIGCDYATDPQRANVYDPSMDTLRTVNMILCLVAQTGYADLVNQGDYKAQIDTVKCNDGGDGGSAGSEQGQSSGANAAAPEVWTLHSERASNGSDQIVEFWVPEGDGESNPGAKIWVRMVVSEGASPSNPFGVFTLNFAGVPEGGTIDDAFMRGTLATLDVLDGFIGFSFYEEHGDIGVAQAPGEHAEITQANVNMFADQSNGVAHIRRRERSNFGGGDSGVQDTTYRIAFDMDDVLRGKDADPPTCLSRTEFDTRVWRYGLYDAVTGARIERNSGFGFRTSDGGYGWIGYYGMWTPSGVDVNDGDVVTRNVFGQSAADAYSVVKAPGKLVKNVKRTLDLAELEGEQFNWWDFGTPGQPPQGPPVQYRIEYDSGVFSRVAVWNENAHEFDDLQPGVVIDDAAYGYLGMYSDGLNGPVSFVHGNAYVTYWEQSFVNGSSDAFGGADELTLYGWFNCLRSGITGAEASAGDVYSAPSFDPATPYAFRFEKDTLTLHAFDGVTVGDAIGLADGETYQGGPFGWGLRAGPLVPSTTGIVDVNDVWNADVFYTYETGPNPWNQYASLVDANGQAVSFDPPLQFRYTHASSNDRNEDPTFDGRNFVLAYDGPGELHGFPFVGVDLDGDGNPDRFYPELSLLDGTLVGPTGTEYVVKALEMEQTLSFDPTGCGALDIQSVDSLPLPDGSGFEAPDIGPEPAVTDPPRVIEGDVLEASIDG